MKEYIKSEVLPKKSSTKKQSAIMKQISRKQVPTLKTDEITAFLDVASCSLETGTGSMSDIHNARIV
jgi:hypothetical protein